MLFAGNLVSQLNPLVIIAGPTATGKSSLAVELSLRLNGAVISADSMQVYRGMDIGTAKITRQEMRGIRHYLIDVADPSEEWNVVRFQAAARLAEERIRGEGRLPFLCGGTGFYIQAFVRGIAFTETADDPEYRKELEQLAAEKGPAALYHMLQACDPDSAASIHPNNIKRVIRALEYYRLSGGEPISEHNRREKQRPDAYDTMTFVLEMPREQLYARIDSRVDAMFEAGLADEVRELQAKGLTDRDVSMQGLGYRQVLQALDGKITMEEAKAAVKEETRHFAKRQATWFRQDRDAIHVDASAAAEDPGAIENRIREHFGKRVMQ
ncbi:MAG: tRNA (adenosine(37)-N6)-dimethylallyltransferase MiaA [Lachnospiraceae bacterium]|nr:tRNA (adenosine(37)-N6)-dimethylallyltransferase MiaA [Lachnospiraceae bacterium]